MTPIQLGATPQQLRNLIACELLAAHSLVNLLDHDIRCQKASTPDEDDPWVRAVRSLHKHYVQAALLYEQLKFLS